jgi:hypothetical protein
MTLWRALYRDDEVEFLSERVLARVCPKPPSKARFNFVSQEAHKQDGGLAEFISLQNRKASKE